MNVLDEDLLLLLVLLKLLVKETIIHPIVNTETSHNIVLTVELGDCEN